MKWADKYRTLKVRTNADTPHDAEVARGFGAEGIGLCRTEHMFFEGERIHHMREMILADDADGREKALAKLLPLPARGLRRHLQGDERPAGDHPPARSAAARVPARTTRRASRRWPSAWASALEQVKQRVSAAARVQPDARPPRLPPGRHLSRDRRDAGPGDHRGRLRRARRRASRSCPRS